MGCGRGWGAAFALVEFPGIITAAMNGLTGVHEYSASRIEELASSSHPGAGELFELSAGSSSVPYYVPRITSTNELLKTRLRAGDGTPLFLVCDEQTSGRGTAGRTWIDRPGKDVLFSIASEFDNHPGKDIFPLLAGTAIARNLSVLTGIQVGVSWPNDLVVGKKKLGGILVEIVQTKYAVVGVGINVRSTVSEFPSDFAKSVTSVSEELTVLGRLEALVWEDKIDRLPILASAVGGVMRALRAKGAHEIGGLIDEFKAIDQTPGTRRMVDIGLGSPVPCECREVDLETGELIVRLPSGELKRIRSASDLSSTGREN